MDAMILNFMVVIKIFKTLLKELVKNNHNGVLFGILLIGIALMLIPGKSENKNELPQKISEQSELERIISSINGVKKAQVMVTYYGSTSSNIVYDITTRGDETERRAVVSGGSAVSTGESFPRVKGVVVIADGARTEEVKRNILSAVTIALDVPEYKVSVLESN